MISTKIKYFESASYETGSYIPSHNDIVAIVHHKKKLKMSVYNTLQVLGISLTDTTPLEDLFNKSNININKELDGFYEPTLFVF